MIDTRGLQQIAELQILLKDALYPATSYDIFQSACRDFFEGDHEIMLERYYDKWLKSNRMLVPTFVANHARDIRKGDKPLLSDNQTILVA